jgi:membrane protease YdiL (CAAX protease family)
MKPSIRHERIQVIEIILFLSGILMFAFFIGRPGILVIIGIAGLVLSVISVGLRIKAFSDLAPVFGFGRLSGVSFYFMAIAGLAGLLLGMIYRNSLHIGVIPERLTGFALVASLISATEELLFRGYLQSGIRRFGLIFSVLATDVAHTGYKFLFFLSMQAGPEISLTGLVIWTLAGGVIIGLLKEYSKSTVIPVIAHMVFDIIVYGDRVIAPWWIWA